LRKILVSSCLLGHKVRYDGKHSASGDQLIQQWSDRGMIVPFCPEVAAGLPIPRPAVEIISQQPLQLQDSQATDYTQAFIKGAKMALQLAQRHNIDCVLLKSKSPSCGRDLIYDGKFQQQLVSGHGVTVKLLMQHQIKVFTELELPEMAEHLRQE